MRDKIKKFCTSLYPFERASIIISIVTLIVTGFIGDITYRLQGKITELTNVQSNLMYVQTNRVFWDDMYGFSTDLENSDADMQAKIKELIDETSKLVDNAPKNKTEFDKQVDKIFSLYKEIWVKYVGIKNKINFFLVKEMEPARILGTEGITEFVNFVKIGKPIIFKDELINKGRDIYIDYKHAGERGKCIDSSRSVLAELKKEKANIFSTNPCRLKIRVLMDKNGLKYFDQLPNGSSPNQH